MDTLLIALGTAVVLLALADIFLSVLYARMGVGLLTPYMYRLTWRIMKAVSPGQGKGKGKNFFLSFAGPLMMVQTVVMWLTLLLVGFTLIHWPAMGSGVEATSGATPTDFWSTLYYSGYSLTTLGTGNFVPKTSPYRILMVLQAAIGFSVVTLTLTYFMSVYSALVRRNTLAQMLHHLSGGSGDPVQLVSGLASGGPSDSRSELVQVGSSVLDLLESHHSYPVLHYFRMRDPRYAMSKIAYLTLESATLIRTALGPSYDTLKSSAAMNLFWGSGYDLLQQTEGSLLGGGSPSGVDHVDAQERLGQSISSLAAAGIDTSESEEALPGYLDAREKWIGTTRAFSDMMAYEWSDIEFPLKKPD